MSAPQRATALLLLSWLPTLAVAEASATESDAEKLPEGYHLSTQMRDTGYVLGDLMQQRVVIDAPPTARLADDSVPRIGRVNNWMELRSERVEHRHDTYTLTLTYQVFGAVDGALQLVVPGYRLRFTDGTQTVTLPVAPQPFYLSPVLPATLDEQDSLARPSAPPAPLPERPALIGAGLSLGAALLIGVYLAWACDRLPGLPREPGPLTRLFRRLRARRSPLLQAGAYAMLLREVQQAFNRSASETLYVDNLSLLFARAPHLLPLQADIRSLFTHSRAVFYGGDAPPEAWPPARIVALCRAARDCERGLR